MMMARRSTLLSMVVGLAVAAVVQPGGRAAAGAELGAQDRRDIQELVNQYARALGSCAAEQYADLFAPDAYFFSSFRGEVTGRDRLIALVRSERHCNQPAGANAVGATSSVPANGPTVVAEPSPEGAVGKASLGSAGHYEDVYVKTSAGWRFKARTVITPQEDAAKLTSGDFVELCRLAGNHLGRFDDIYVETPQGRRFRSSGVVFALVPEGMRGTASLKDDGGRYEDVYVRTERGWRFKSRTYVAAGS
jgi:hypothetical protein